MNPFGKSGVGRRLSRCLGVFLLVASGCATAPTTPTATSTSGEPQLTPEQEAAGVELRNRVAVVPVFRLGDGIVASKVKLLKGEQIVVWVAFEGKLHVDQPVPTGDTPATAQFPKPICMQERFCAILITPKHVGTFQYDGTVTVDGKEYAADPQVEVIDN